MWLAVCLVMTVALTFSPFEGSLKASAVRDRINEALGKGLTDFDFSSIPHFFLFFLIGVLVAAAFHRRLDDRSPGMIVLVVSGACLAFEMIQFLLPLRHARFTDLALHVLGILLGLWSMTRWKAGRRWGRAMQERLRSHPAVSAVAMMVIGFTTWFGSMLHPAFAGPRLDWTAYYPIVIGNERFGMRPWLGEILYAGVYGRALSGVEVLKRWQEMEAGPEAKGAGEPEVLIGYDFRRGPVEFIAPEGPLGSKDLAMEVPRGCEWVSGGGMLITEPVIMLTPGSAYELTEALASSGEFSVEAWVRPANLTQTGPARIFSVSPGIHRRNFTLGQSGDAVVFRVQNKVNGANGSKFPLEAAGLDDGAMQHWIAVYDRGVSRIYRDGKPMEEVVDLRDPDFSLPFGPGAGGRAIAMVFLVVTVAVPVAITLISRVKGRWAHLLGLLACGSTSIAPQVLFAPFAEAKSHLSLETLLLQVAVILLAYPLILRCVTPPEAEGGAEPAALKF